MLKPAKIIISVLSVVAATVFGFSVPAFASDGYPSPYIPASG